MRKYEIMFIVRPTLSEDEKKNVIAKFVKVLTDNKATITNEKDFKSGFYYLVDLEANDDAAISEFDRQAKNTSDIVRHLITKIED